AYYADIASRNHNKHQHIEPELPQLMKAARIACKKADWQLLQPLWRVVSSSLWRLSDWSTYRRFDEKCLNVARKTGDRHVESRILSELGWVSLEEGKWEEANAYFK
ncbi:MAG: hypothetical protein GWO41_01645, partial [candidate division Zixibacteria bacterium]|nr:hypothetical protein [candidate division Zixibacteria bacterium]NIR62334.1 hypothetical protein [candidate division Zixibacteria bacterium]NIS44545.1 hypothetical protein [candidate division Zixibacteria bacterium]NIT51472.1 hypothetical protein [candidate division Zixibacteria bacterium]NIU12567.1 hypothetical protein [candidate division Zixibacteria bacterium]